MLVGLALIALPASAQVVVEGRVIDAETREPLPAATVQVEGQSAGAVTNADGHFRLLVPSVPAALIARYIGYRSQRLEIETPPGEAVLMALRPDPVPLDEIVVSGEDPGVDIMRRVLAAKAAWQDTVGTVYSEVYSRFMLFADNRPVQMEETIGASYWSAGRGVREVVRARRTRPVRAERFLYAGPLAVPNLYADDVRVDGTRFVGPLNAGALDWYRFRLTGRRQLDGQTVYDIAFSPLDATDAVFVGGLAVQDSTFDVLSITARPVVDRLGPPPVIERSVRVSQQFVRRGGAMLPVGFQAEGWVRFGRAGVGYPVARYRQVAGQSLHATGVPVPDSLFAGSRQRVDGPEPERQQWLFTWNPGLVPPTEADLRDIRAIDPARPLASVFRPTGMLRQYVAVPVSSAQVEPDPEDLAAEMAPVQWFRPWVWYNRVDGWHIGLRPLFRPVQSLDIELQVAYDEARGAERGNVKLADILDGISGGVRADWRPQGGFRYAVGADRLTTVVGVGSHRSRLIAGFATYAGLDDYFDYYDRARLYGEVGWWRDRVDLSVKASREQHRSAARNDDFNGWLVRNEQRDNPTIDEGALTSLTLHARLGREPHPDRPIHTYVQAELEGAATDVFGSDLGFVRWHIAASWRRATWLRRRRHPATMRIAAIYVGGSPGTPLQREGVLDVASGFVVADAGLYARRGQLLRARSGGGVFWEHDFGPLLTAWLGLGETTFGVSLFGGHAQKLQADAKWEHEIGLGVTAPFNLPLRVNVATATGSLNPIVSVTLFERLSPWRFLR